jgi:hypothetical protein
MAQFEKSRFLMSIHLGDVIWGKPNGYEWVKVERELDRWSERGPQCQVSGFVMIMLTRVSEALARLHGLARDYNIVSI